MDQQTPWVEKDTPKYFNFMDMLKDNHKKAYGPNKLAACIICWNMIKTKDTVEHLFHNNYILTSVHFRDEDSFLKLARKHSKLSNEGDKIMIFNNSDLSTFEQHRAEHSTSLNQISRDLMDSTCTTVIREAEPGIPGVVRKSGAVDDYGGRDLLNLTSDPADELNLNSDMDPDESNKKSIMEPKEVEFRQEQNIEELKRIGIFIHSMKTKNKKAEKHMRELEVQLKSVESTVEDFRTKLKMPKVVSKAC